VTRATRGRLVLAENIDDRGGRLSNGRICSAFGGYAWVAKSGLSTYFAEINRRSPELSANSDDRKFENVVRQRELSMSYANDGDALVAQGNVTEALVLYRKSLAIRERFAQVEPNSAVWEREIAAIHNKIGDALVMVGDLNGALVSFYNSLAIRERLVGLAPDNVDWLRRTAGLATR
jgi:tetratricopeptide (TPR) repeat protein